MADNSLNLAKDINLNIQETEQIQTEYSQRNPHQDTS